MRTVRGRTFAVRAAASLLEAVGLPKLITESANAFVETAIALARSSERLSHLWAGGIAARDTSPLFVTVRTTWALEWTYAEI